MREWLGLVLLLVGTLKTTLGAFAVFSVMELLVALPAAALSRDLGQAAPAEASG